MSESVATRCAARVAGAACQNAGTNQRLKTENIHEKHFFRLYDEHQQAWNSGKLGPEQSEPGRVTSWVG